MPLCVDLDSEPLRLQGGHCEACGLVFFPMQTYGCENCGAHGETLRTLSLDAQGTVAATTVVYREFDPRRPTPFRIVEVVLQDGPTVHGIAADQSEPDIGDVVQLIRVDNVPSDELRGVRFTAAKKENVAP